MVLYSVVEPVWRLDVFRCFVDLTGAMLCVVCTCTQYAPIYYHQQYFKCVSSVACCCHRPIPILIHLLFASNREFHYGLRSNLNAMLSLNLVMGREQHSCMTQQLCFTCHSIQRAYQRYICSYIHTSRQWCICLG